jgi:hypothetical protein
MSDRVPICTIPGLVSAILDTDVMVAPADVAKLVTRVFLQRTDNGAGDVVTAALRNATGGGGDAISVTLADGESEQVATGTMTIEATEALYLRVSATDANSQNLRGWFEVDGAAGVTSALTTLARVKQFLDISGAGDDDLMNNLIASVSDEIQVYLDRKIIQATATDEKIDSIGDCKIHTRYFPIISISSLEEDGTALVEDTGFECKEWDKLEGALVRISSGDPTAWARGTRVVKTTYTHGYADVPYAIVQAATELAAFDYLQSSASAQGRFGLTGTTLDSGGASGYTSREDLWRALRPRLGPYRRLFM